MIFLPAPNMKKRPLLLVRSTRGHVHVGRGACDVDQFFTKNVVVDG